MCSGGSGGGEWPCDFFAHWAKFLPPPPPRQQGQGWSGQHCCNLYICKYGFCTRHARAASKRCAASAGKLRSPGDKKKRCLDYLRASWMETTEATRSKGKAGSLLYFGRAQNTYCCVVTEWLVGRSVGRSVIQTEWWWWPQKRGSSATTAAAAVFCCPCVCALSPRSPRRPPARPPATPGCRHQVTHAPPLPTYTAKVPWGRLRFLRERLASWVCCSVCSPLSFTPHNIPHYCYCYMWQ